MVIALIAVVAAAAGAKYGYDSFTQSKRQRTELMSEFARLKQEARQEQGLPRAEKLLEGGNIDAAISALEERAGDATTSADVNAMLADLYIKRGRREDAIFQYKLAIDKNPKDKSVLLKQAELLAAENRGLSACDTLKKAVEIDPNDTDTRFKLAEMQYQNKLYNEAAANYSMIVVLKGEEPSSLQGLGHIMLYQNRPKEALGYYERAVSVDAGLGESWYFIARLNLALEKFDVAIPALRKAISLSYPDRLLRLYLATALEYSGNVKEAIAEYKRFVAEYPSYPKAETIKLHVSQLEFWEEAPRANYDNIGASPRPWGDSIIPFSQGESGGIGGQ